MELDLDGEQNGHNLSENPSKKERAEQAGATPIPVNATTTNDCSEEDSTNCGYGPCHPGFLQYFATVKWFLAFMSLYVLLQSLIVSGYTSSVITTIEKRYDLRSTESGVIVSSFDIGSLLVVVFISYFGGKGHRTRWIGIGTAIVGLGSILFSSPQFIASPYQLPGTKNSTSSHLYLCQSNTSHNTTDDETACVAKNPNSLYIFLFVISNMIIGIGSTPIYTLGTTYIYDNAPREGSSLYIAIMYVMGAIGPALGYVLGGALISFYVDPWLEGVPSDDPRFIGAWWSGYVLCGFLVLFSAIPLLGYPRRLPKPPAEVSDTASNGTQTPSTPVTTVTVSDDENLPYNDNDAVNPMDASMNFGKNIKDLPRAFVSLLCNPIFLCITATATLEFSIVTAFLTFVPKYLQNQFGIDPSQASIYTGVVLVPSAGGGILLGGYIVKRFRLSITGCAKVPLVSNVISIMLFVAVFFIWCPSIDIIGIAHETCTSCQCESTAYEPVCISGSTYYNPCMAGCTDVKYSNGTHVSPVEFLNCSCIETSNVGTPGMCERDCTSYFIPFMVCLFFLTMATATAQTPALMVTLRCVKNDERPFAMGLQFVFFRALAYIPSPIYFGSAIDSACLIWRGSSDECEQGSGACQVYDASQFRYIYFGLAVSLKFAAGLFVFFTWMLCRRAYSVHDHTTKYRRERQKKERQNKKQKKATSEANHNSPNTYGSVYGRSQVDNMGSKNSRGEFSGISNNANNNNLSTHSTSVPGNIDILRNTTLVNVISSSESESSMGSSGSQKPLISNSTSRPKTSRPSPYSSSMLSASNLELKVVPEKDSIEANTQELDVTDVAL